MIDWSDVVFGVVMTLGLGLVLGYALYGILVFIRWLARLVLAIRVRDQMSP